MNRLQNIVLFFKLLKGLEESRLYRSWALQWSENVTSTSPASGIVTSMHCKGSLKCDQSLNNIFHSFAIFCHHLCMFNRSSRQIQTLGSGGNLLVIQVGVSY